MFYFNFYKEKRYRDNKRYDRTWNQLQQELQRSFKDNHQDQLINIFGIGKKTKLDSFEISKHLVATIYQPHREEG